MRKLFLTLSLILISMIGISQNVGIGTTMFVPAASSMLEIQSTTKGVLIPRVSLTSSIVAAPVVAPANSLLVFNINTAGVSPNNVTPGYYFWNSSTTRWERLFSGTGTAWTTLGNTGTVAGTNFFGTIDNVSIDYRTNNIIRGRISNLGEWTWGATSTAMIGDLTSTVSNVTFPWALNGYSANNGSGVFGSITSGATVYGAIQGEYLGTNSGGAGVRGCDNMDLAYGINGQSGTWGWAGWFDGDLNVTGGYYNISDIKFKKNIIPLNSALDKIMKINIVEFDFDTEKYSKYSLPKRHQYGVIAQDFELIFPEMVKKGTIQTLNVTRTSEDKNVEQMEVKTVNYYQLIPILTKAIQEQQEQIKILEQRIIELENKQ